LAQYAAAGKQQDDDVDWVDIIDDQWKVPVSGFKFKGGPDIPIKAS